MSGPASRHHPRAATLQTPLTPPTLPTLPTLPTPWTGGFAEREAGIRVRTDARRSLVPVELLVGVALRRNPRRAQLLVSTVLAKHVPTDPGLVIVAAELLGMLVGGELDGGRRPPAGLFVRLARILERQGGAVAAGPRVAAVAEPGVAAVAEVAGFTEVARSAEVPAGSAGVAGVAAECAGSAGVAGRTAKSAGPGGVVGESAAQESTQWAGELRALRADVARLRSDHPEVVTIGYAETATGLGQLVAGAVGSYYIHSTRHAPVGRTPFAGFEEEHSHATSHQLYPRRPDWLRAGGTVVLVDDELSTGTTIVNTIRALQSAVPQSRWVVAALIDLRSVDDRRRFDDLALELGTSIAVVSLGAGSIDLPSDVIARAQRALAGAASAPQPPSRGPELLQSRAEGAVSVLSMPVVATTRARGGAARRNEIARGVRGRVVVVEVAVGVELPSARFGVDGGGGTDAERTADGVGRVARAVAPLLRGGSTLVLGSEEFIALPLAVADALAEGSAGAVRFSTTTRSPISPIDRDDYAIASAIGFQSHDVTHDGFGPRFAYNVTRGGRRFDQIVFVPEPAADRDRMFAPGGIVEALRDVTDVVIVVTLDASHPTTLTASAPAAATPTPPPPSPTTDESAR